MNLNQWIFIIGSVFLHTISLAQSDSSDARTSVNLSKEVINPSTLMWQLQLEEKIITKFEDQEGVGQKFRLRMIMPIERGLIIKVPQLIRFIAFYNTLPGHGSGFGDVTFNQFWILSQKHWGNWGLGYNLQIPTATNKYFGSPQWGIGPAFTITFKNIGNWEMYFIVQNFFSISKNKEYGHFSTMVFQPNIFYTWSNGIYTGIEPLWQLDYKTGAIDFPLNWRLGYIFKSKRFKYNAYVEPEWKTYRSNNFTGNNENFSVKLGFRIFFPESKKHKE